MLEPKKGMLVKTKHCNPPMYGIITDVTSLAKWNHSSFISATNHWVKVYWQHHKKYSNLTGMERPVMTSEIEEF